MMLKVANKSVLDFMENTGCFSINKAEGRSEASVDRSTKGY